MEKKIVLILFSLFAIMLLTTNVLASYVGFIWGEGSPAAQKTKTDEKLTELIRNSPLMPFLSRFLWSRMN